MSDNQHENLDETVQDTEGHFRPMYADGEGGKTDFRPIPVDADSDEDTEGHFRPMYADGQQQGAEGYFRSYPAASDEEDTEGHFRHIWADGGPEEIRRND